MKRVLLLLGCCLLLAQTSPAQSVVINEFMADNDNTVQDQDGEFDDWIELFNNSSSAINLSGYSLSDDSDELDQWIFPEVTIGAGEFLVIWADNDGDQAGLHTNFKLSSSGEEVCLSDANATLIDQVVFGPQQLDISYGRYPDGTGDFRVMYPTFGETNRQDGPAVTEQGGDLFDPSIVQRIDLEFYVDNWQDSLKYYFEDLDEEYIPVRFVLNDTLVLDSVGIRYKGNSTYARSQNTPKKPLKLDFDQYRDGVYLLDLEKLNLHNGVSDPTCLRETLGYEILRNYLPAPRTGFADVYVDGELLGFYTMVEQIDEIFLSQHFENNTFNLYKAGDDGAPLLYRGADQAEYEDEYELKTNEDDNDWSRFIEMINVLNNASDESFLEEVGPWIDFDSVLRLTAFYTLLSSFDSYMGSGRNYYFYDNESGPNFTMLPWDMNETFGVYSNGWNVITQDAYSFPNSSQRPLIKRLLEQDSLRTVYNSYIREMMEGPAAPDTLAERVNSLSALVRDHVYADQNKLYSDDEFDENLESDVFIEIGRRVPGLLGFIEDRYANLETQLDQTWVYPGDTNNDGLVNAEDILPIGVYFLETGSVRSGAGMNWNGQASTPWTVAEAAYADANGDGEVNEIDVVAIGVNWGATHTVSTTSFVIDPDNPDLLSIYGNNLRTLYHSLNGSGEAIAEMKELLERILQEVPDLPVSYSLEQNFPNPFNQATTIRFSLPDASMVHLSLINVLGQVVQQPVASRMNAGTHSISIDASSLSSGIYLYRLDSSYGSLTRKLVLCK